MDLLFLGDVMLGRLVNRMLEKKPPEYPWGDTLPLIRKADLRICNLECVISDFGVPWSATPKVFHFRTDEKNIKCLKAAGIDIVSLANNHVLDFEYDALTGMLSILDREGVVHAGAGNNIKEASQPAMITIDGLKVALVAFTDNEPSWEAQDSLPGVLFCPIDIRDERAKGVFEIVRQTKAKADIVIASAHWGPNWGYRPRPKHIPFAHALIDAGADIVFGHSCHVFHGIEMYKKRAIIYSAGDFIDDYAVDEIERNDESFIFIVHTEGKRITGLTLHPTIISEFQASMAWVPRAELISAKMKNLCSEFGTKAEWNGKRHCLKVEVS